MKCKELISIILMVVNVLLIVYCLTNNNKSNAKLKKIQSKLNSIKDDLSNINNDVEDLTEELNEIVGKKDKKKKVKDIVVDEDINADDIADIDTVDYPEEEEELEEE